MHCIPFHKTIHKTSIIYIQTNTSRLYMSYKQNKYMVRGDTFAIIHLLHKAMWIVHLSYIIPSHRFRLLFFLSVFFLLSFLCASMQLWLFQLNIRRWATILNFFSPQSIFIYSDRKKPDWHSMWRVVVHKWWIENQISL